MAGLRAARMVAPSQRWLRLLVVSQVVLVFVVLVSASLFLRALRHATAMDPGFEPEKVLGVGINPRLAQMDEQAGRTLLEDLRQEAASLPGVEAVALTSRVPLTLGARFFPNPLVLEIPGWQGGESVEDQHIGSRSQLAVFGRCRAE